MTSCIECGWDIDEQRTCPVCGADQPDADVHVEDEMHPPTPSAAPSGSAPPPPPPHAASAPAWPVHAVAPHPSGLSNDVRTFGMLIHLSAFAAAAIGFSFVGPLVLWLVKREEHPFLDHHGREALNFNLSLLLYSAIGFVLAVVTLGFGLILVIPAAIAVAVLWVVVTILAAVKANNGESYRYPLSIRFVTR